MYSSIHFNAKPRATTNASKPEVLEKLRQIVGAENVLVDAEKVEPYGADAVKEKFGLLARKYCIIRFEVNYANNQRIAA